jgi:asparagine synthase (glutamine-hydrolysing)
MCGIAGIVRRIEAGRKVPPPGVSIPEAWLDQLDRGVAHRGPDGQGRFRGRAAAPDGATVDVALVHRRLSILDHAGGGQPMVSERPGGTVGVAFNGCIYNHRELRRELAGLGHAFATDHSDTEVLVHGTREWGAGLARRLDGMYAYAAWDQARATLVLARDQAGEKPLYLWWLGEGLLAFASTMPALVACAREAGNEIEIEPRTTLMWLKHGYWPRVPLGTGEAPPGVVYALGPGPIEGPQGGIAWHERVDPCPAAGDPTISLHEGEALALLERAVTSRLEADVPIGCFLSGGVDSSVVAALAQKAMRASGRTLKTFTVKMPDARMDETPYANMVAEHLGTEHAVLECRASAADDLVKLIEQLGLPFGDSSILPTHWVSAAARRHVTVALGGDGGDELFGGYKRYRVNSLMHRLRGPLRATRWLPEWAVRGLGGNLARVATAARCHGYDDILSIFRTPQLRRLINRRLVDQVLEEQYRGRRVGGDARLDDFGVYLPCDLMRKVDTAAMSVALEVRAPMLARELVASALRASLGDVEAGEGRKGLLRRIARGLVPPEAVDRKKMGFGVPMGRWFREDFGGLRTLLRDRLASAAPFPGVPLEFDRRALERLVDDHMSGRRDHAQRLFALVSLSVWAEWLKGG